MIEMTPTKRLEWLLGQEYLASAHSIVSDLTAKYERFLETTDAEEGQLIDRFLDKERSREYMAAAYKFGDLMFDALNSIGSGNKFHRLLVV